MDYLLLGERLTEKYLKEVLTLFLILIFLFGFIFGIIVGEYREMIYLTEMINDTAYGIPKNNILKTDSGLFIIHPYIDDKYNLSVVIP